MAKIIERDAATLVDLGRYPITDLKDPEARRLIEQGRGELARHGALALPGFLNSKAISLLAAEAERLTPLAFDIVDSHTPYFAPPDFTVPEGDPRNSLQRSAKGGIAFDDMPADAALVRLYLWDELRDFIAALLGEPQLYRHADPIAALNTNVFKEGQELAWHFDRADFVTTLSLQTAKAGGAFEYVPMIRNAEVGDENYAGVAKLLAGDRQGVVTLPLEAGTLALFRGHNSIHRVTKVQGSRPRLVAALSYTREPGQKFSTYARKLFYGRAGAKKQAATSGSG